MLLAESVILSSEFWTSPIMIKERAVQILSGEAPALEVQGLSHSQIAMLSLSLWYLVYTCRDSSYTHKTYTLASKA